MKDVSSQNFGYLIAFVLPGFVTLHALGMLNPAVAEWLHAQATHGEQPTVGGFLYITLASVAAGITASTLRWLVVDTAHHFTGISRPAWDDSKLQERLTAFEALVTAHYRYYQFYGNSVVALAALLGLHVQQTGQFDWLMDTPVALLIALFWFGSRDSLSRYYSRAAVLLGDQAKEDSHDERTPPIHKRKARQPRGRGRTPGVSRSGVRRNNHRRPATRDASKYTRVSQDRKRSRSRSHSRVLV